MAKTNPKVAWARKQIGVELKKAKTVAERKKVFKKVWAEAKRKFG
jgi:hypothetical protein